MPEWPIPTEFPLTELLGQEVTQVCIGLGQVQIHFYRQPQPGTPDKWKPCSRIEAETAFSLGNTGRPPHRVEQQDFCRSGGTLTSLLGQTVTDARREAGNELQLLFSGGLALVLHADQQGFESYHLHIAGESVTVTRA
jgi:hypothetical protein